MNTKAIGNIGLGQAIAYFTSIGVTVSVPLNDSQKYDLLIDSKGELFRIQVKTTSVDELGLRTTGGNQSFHTAKSFDPHLCDFLFVYNLDGRSWLIPTKTFKNKSSMTLKSKYDRYRL